MQRGAWWHEFFVLRLGWWQSYSMLVADVGHSNCYYLASDIQGKVHDS